MPGCIASRTYGSVSPDKQKRSSLTHRERPRLAPVVVARLGAHKPLSRGVISPIETTVAFGPPYEMRGRFSELVYSELARLARRAQS
jgi:hypothetical protein